MRTPFRWTRPWQASLQTVCACCALWGVPGAVLAAPDQGGTTPAVSSRALPTPAPAAPTSTASHGTARSGGVSLIKPVLMLVTIGCVVGMIVGWVSGGGPRETRVRLLNKPKKMHASVLMPSTPAPRLVPGDSPNATRARSTHAPLPRQTPANARRSGVIDYIAAFADAGEANAGSRIDYLLVSSEEDSLDAPDGFAGSPRDGA